MAKKLTANDIIRAFREVDVHEYCPPEQAWMVMPSDFEQVAATLNKLLEQDDD